ncbi:hypothetical protein ACOMHN_027517 [Nucella lapillus]
MVDVCSIVDVSSHGHVRRVDVSNHDICGHLSITSARISQRKVTSAWLSSVLFHHHPTHATGLLGSPLACPVPPSPHTCHGSAWLPSGLSCSTITPHMPQVCLAPLWSVLFHHHPTHATGLLGSPLACPVPPSPHTCHRSAWLSSGLSCSTITPHMPQVCLAPLWPVLFHHHPTHATGLLGSPLASPVPPSPHTCHRSAWLPSGLSCSTITPHMPQVCLALLWPVLFHHHPTHATGLLGSPLACPVPPSPHTCHGSAWLSSGLSCSTITPHMPRVCLALLWPVLFHHHPTHATGLLGSPLSCSTITPHMPQVCLAPLWPVLFHHHPTHATGLLGSPLACPVPPSPHTCHRSAWLPSGLSCSTITPHMPQVCLATLWPVPPSRDTCHGSAWLTSVCLFVYPVL